MNILNQLEFNIEYEAGFYSCLKNVSYRVSLLGYQYSQFFLWDHGCPKPLFHFFLKKIPIAELINLKHQKLFGKL